MLVRMPGRQLKRVTLQAVGECLESGIEAVRANLLQGVRAAFPGLLSVQSLLARSSLGLRSLRSLLLPCQLSLEALDRQ